MTTTRIRTATRCALALGLLLSSANAQVLRQFPTTTTPAQTGRTSKSPLQRLTMPDLPFLGGGRNYNSVYGLAAGDLNGDGYRDLVVATLASASPGLLIYSNGDPRDADQNGVPDAFPGNFTDVTGLSSGRPGNGFMFHDHSCVTLGDLDNDGDLDIVAGSRTYTPGLRVYENLGGFVFQMRLFQGGWPVGQAISDIALGDTNGDAYLDIVAATNYGGVAATRTVYVTTTPPTGAGLPTYTDSTLALPLPTANPAIFDGSEAVALGDFDADGDLDIFLGNQNVVWPNGVPANTAPPRNRLLRNNLAAGAATFTDITTGSLLEGAARATTDLELVDFDQDGDQDLVVANRAGFGSTAANQILINTGAGGGYVLSAAAGLSLGTPKETSSLGVGDVDEDCNLDIVFGDGGQTEVYRYIGDANGNGALDAAEVVRATAARIGVDAGVTHAIVVADMDADNDLDVLVGEDRVTHVSYYPNLHRDFDAPQTVSTGALGGAIVTLLAYNQPGYGVQTNEKADVYLTLSALFDLGAPLFPLPRTVTCPYWNPFMNLAVTGNPINGGVLDFTNSMPSGSAMAAYWVPKPSAPTSIYLTAGPSASSVATSSFSNDLSSTLKMTVN